MPVISCPGCGEDEELTGRTDANGRTILTCERCGTSWERELAPRCTLCGSDDLEAVPTSTLEEAGRGDQRTPSGIRNLYRCWNCGARNATSPNAVPADAEWKRERSELTRSYRPRRP